MFAITTEFGQFARKPIPERSMLSEKEVQAYRDNGFIMARSLIEPALMDAIRAEVDEVVNRLVLDLNLAVSGGRHRDNATPHGVGGRSRAGGVFRGGLGTAGGDEQGKCDQGQNGSADDSSGSHGDVLRERSA